MQAGEKVTVLIDPKGRAHPGRVVRKARQGRFAVILGNGVSKEFRADDEGLTWCRGWEGPAVDALQAAAALA